MKKILKNIRDIPVYKDEYSLLGTSTGESDLITTKQLLKNILEAKQMIDEENPFKNIIMNEHPADYDNYYLIMNDKDIPDEYRPFINPDFVLVSKQNFLDNCIFIVKKLSLTLSIMENLTYNGS